VKLEESSLDAEEDSGRRVLSCPQKGHIFLADRIFVVVIFSE
jgi:hypothetical protein